MVVLRSLALSLALAVTGGGLAQAHIGLTPKTAPAGAYQVLRFGVGHGCEGKATTALRIEIPAGVASARPQPKPGWDLQIERGDPTAAPRAISWRGELPADQYEEFLIQVRLPPVAGPLAFPAVQSCGGETVRWIELAPPGAPRPPRPAPLIELSPAPAAPAATPAPHAHHH